MNNKQSFQKSVLCRVCFLAAIITVCDTSSRSSCHAFGIAANPIGQKRSHALPHTTYMVISGSYEQQQREDPLTCSSTIGHEDSFKYLRIKEHVSQNRRLFQLQTCIIHLERQRHPTSSNDQVVSLDLHALIHFGTADYFSYYNHLIEQYYYDQVFYELLISETLLSVDSHGRRTLTQNIMPKLSDANMARQYDLCCQLDFVNYKQPDWIHADWTREEFSLANHSPRSSWTQRQSIQRLVQGLLSPLYRPLTPATSSNNTSKQRLFSNLFLPGDALSKLLRVMFWILLPSPELYVLLLDWSSVVDPKPSGSSVAIPVVECLLCGDVKNARLLIFSQLLVSGQYNSFTNNVEARNEKSIEVVSKYLTGKKSAMLYGAMHCKDLHLRLTELGFQPYWREWRTAWTVSVPIITKSERSKLPTKNVGNDGVDGITDHSKKHAVNTTSTTLILVMLLYLLVGALDYIETAQHLSKAVVQEDWWSLKEEAGMLLLLYLGRHVALYVGLVKFLIDWSGTEFCNDNE